MQLKQLLACLTAKRTEHSAACVQLNISICMGAGAGLHRQSGGCYGSSTWRCSAGCWCKHGPPQGESLALHWGKLGVAQPFWGAGRA